MYCVFDKDIHATYNKTIASIDSKKTSSIFYATTSIPCFEYWLLLHFKYTTRPYAQAGSSSVCDKVLKELLKFMPDYKKEKEQLFCSLFKKLESAKSNAVRALQEANNNDTDNPSTNVHELVEYLQNIRGL